MIYLEWTQMELHVQIKFEANGYRKTKILVSFVSIFLTFHKPLVQYSILQVYNITLDHNVLNVQRLNSFVEHYHLT